MIIIYFFWGAIELIESRASCMRGKGFTTELHPQSSAHVLFLGQSLTELPREFWSSPVSRVAGMMGLSH